MEEHRAPHEIEALIREIARLEQLVAEKKFDEYRDLSEYERASRMKQKI